MGFVKSVSCEIDHLIINMICSLLINAILNTALYVFFLIAVHKILAFLLHDRRLLLGHGTAHQIASAHGIARQIANDLHNLFLVDDTAIGRSQNMLQLRTFICDGGLIILSFQITRNEIHRSRTIERNSRNDILQVFGPQLLHEAFHSRTLQLEDAIALSGANGCQDIFIIIINFFHNQMNAVVFLCLTHRILNDSQGSEA